MRFIIHNIHCAGCISSIEKKLHKNKIRNFQLSFANKSLLVEEKISATKVIQSLQEIGYGCEQVFNVESSLKKQKKKQQEDYLYYKNRSLVALIFGGALMFYAWSGATMQVQTAGEQIFWFTIAILTLLVMYYSGKHFYLSAFQKIRFGQTNMDSLIVLSTSIAFFYSCFVLFFPKFFPVNARHFYFEASIMIIGLVNLGSYLEIKSKQKTYRVIESLFQIQAKTARVVDPKTLQEKEILITKVKKGDWIRVLSGEKIPLDAKILKGAGNVDESALSGEFAPVFKTKGMEVIGSSINLEGSFLAQVQHTTQTSLLSQIITLVEQAQNSKPPIARLADKIASVFVPIILLIAFTTAIFWYFFAVQNPILLMFITSTCVLIIACPCALGLATPISVMAGIHKAAKQGILIHSATALQNLNLANILILDKTGTITEGKPQIINFQNFSQKSKLSILQIATSLERGTKHPFALAFLSLAEQNKLQDFLPIENFKTIIGRGVQGKISKKQFFLGSEKWIKELGFTFEQTASEEIGTKILLANEKKVLAFFILTDTIKPTSKKAIKQLQAKGMEVIIASGDEQKNVDFVAKECGVPLAFGSLSPQDKRQKILEMQKKQKKVIFVGDGTNDAAALAAADIGMAMSSGTDIAIESASLVLMSHSLDKVLHAINISKKTLRNMKQNLFFAFSYNVICIPIAAGVLYPIAGILLNPVFAAMAMSLSSLSLVLNSIRLYYTS